MKTIVFVGPSLHAEDLRAHTELELRAPAAQGDVYCAALERPWGIAIIDGYFERVPAVWHKEILWALAQGVHVFGAASMGALRAAELHPFGMQGVGEIFERFRSCELLDDDEVAVAHADAEGGFRPASVALVDMRATLALAVTRGVMDEPLRAALVGLAKRRHYPERSYVQLCQDAERAGLPVARFAAFWREHAVSAKRADALRLLRELFVRRAQQPQPFAASFQFEHTAAFAQLARRFSARADGGRGADVLAELRLQPAQYRRTLAAALTRKLALDFAESRGLQLDAAAQRDAIMDFRRQRALWDGDVTHAFMRAQRLDDDGLRALAQHEAMQRLVTELLGPGLEPQLIECLQGSGEYAALAERARDKRAVLAACGEPEGGASDALSWYFESYLRQAPPEDLERFWRELGYPDAFAFQRAVRREQVCRLNDEENAHGRQ